MEKQITIKGENIQISDGYHTFDKLYEHRFALWIAVCRLVDKDPQYQYRRVWRSKFHSDGSSYEGWFLLGMNVEDGSQISYHLPLGKWEETSFADEEIKAPEWDGHTSDDVLKRLATL